MSQNATYNRLVLIGNGFDLALGLKTSYSSFILDYMQQSISSFEGKNRHQDELISISLTGSKLSTNYIEELITCSSMKDFLTLINEENKILITYKYDFFKKIVTELGEANWVDIEGFYYTIFERELDNQKELPTELKSFKFYEELNTCMDHISIALESYLKREQTKYSIRSQNSPLSGLINRIFAPPDSKEKRRITKNSNANAPSTVIFLNFNYTNTLDQLLGNSFEGKRKTIPIHGSLSSSEYPPIFGYGDDTGTGYKEIELLRNDDILRKIKSFGYSKADLYHNLLDFIDSNIFDVYIVGHSCGLSDKTMLKSIFEHSNCRAIKNFHYAGKDENFRKGIAISRHFDDKALFRQRLLPYDKTAKIPQVNKF